MSSLIFLSLLFLSYTSADNDPPSSPVAAPTTTINQACKATRFPESCQTKLAEPGRLGPNPTSIQVIQAALKVSSDNLYQANTMVDSIAKSSRDSLNRTKATKNCLELLRYSDYRISLANKAFPSGKTKDARAWMSAALLYQYDCWSALKYANDTQMVNQTMSFLNSLTELSSNALSMMVSYDDYGDDMSTWAPPKTERDGFWGKGSDGGSELGSRGGFPSNLKVDVKVCKDGKDGCYKTVQEAVNSAPNLTDARFVIHIMAGVYQETVRVPLEKTNVVFLGDGMGKTVITGSLNVGLNGVTTYDSATVGVVGDGFMASGITFENKGGVEAHQAVAFRSDSDRSVIENCEFLGYQDTLYAHSLRQFYKSCRIQGNVDFIFGNSASIFQDCNILIAPRQVNPEKGENNAVTAHGRRDPAQSTGFVFLNCSINGTEEYMKLYKRNSTLHKNFLGRPWKEYSRAVFIRCNMEELITPQGWMQWDKDFALKTLFYGEFENTGAGSNLSQRVPWSSHIPAEHANTYSVQNFIQGNDWMPSN